MEKKAALTGFYPEGWTGDAQFILMKRKKATCCVWREFMLTTQGMESDSECNRQKREIEKQQNPPIVN